MKKYMEFIKSNMHDPAAVVAAAGAQGQITTPPPQFQQITGSATGNFNYNEFLRLQAAANMDQERKLREQHKQTVQL